MRLPDIPPNPPHRPRGQFVTELQQHDPTLAEEQQYEDVKKHRLLVWTSLSPGDVVSFRWLGTQDCVGTIECRTSDGLRRPVPEAANGPVSGLNGSLR